MVVNLQQRTTEHGNWRYNSKTEGSHGCLKSSTYRPDYKWGDYRATAFMTADIVDKLSFETTSDWKIGPPNSRALLCKAVRQEWKNNLEEEAPKRFHKYAGDASTKSGYEADYHCDGQ